MGRPKGKPLLEQRKILKKALSLLDAQGSRGLSMRSLALSLKVTPMALYNHYPNRTSLLCGVSDMVYGEVTEAFANYSGSTREKLEFLIVSYYKEIIKHPNLSICIFETPDAFSTETHNITQYLLSLISTLKVSAPKQSMWLNILVDFTHGSSIASAKIAVTQKKNNNFVNIESQRFLSELKVLLDCIT